MQAKTKKSPIQIPVIRRSPGRERSGKMYASVSLSLEVDLWVRIDALAAARGKTRHAMLRLVAEAGVAAIEREGKW